MTQLSMTQRSHFLSHRPLLPLWLLALAALLAGGLVACGDTGTGEDEVVAGDVELPPPSAEDLASLPPAGMPDDDATTAPAATHQVILRDYEILIPTPIEAGNVTFEISNQGEHEHNLEIEAADIHSGIERELPTNLQPGERGTLVVDLQPGDYTAYCPVGDHRGKGMETQLQVVAATSDETATATDAADAG